MLGPHGAPDALEISDVVSNLYSANLFRGIVDLNGTGGGAASFFTMVPSGHVWVVLSMDLVDDGGDVGNLLQLTSDDIPPTSGGYWFSGDPGSIGYIPYRGRITFPAGVQLGAWDERGDVWIFSIDGYDLTP